MEALTQLKTMRDDAMQRLAANADYKLLTSLDDLINDLEKVSEPARPALTVIEDRQEEIEEDEFAITEEATDAVDAALEQMTAELDGETDLTENEPHSYASFS